MEEVDFADLNSLKVASALKITLRTKRKITTSRDANTPARQLCDCTELEQCGEKSTVESPATMNVGKHVIKVFQKSQRETSKSAEAKLKEMLHCRSNDHLCLEVQPGYTEFLKMIDKINRSSVVHFCRPAGFCKTKKKREIKSQHLR